jgi:hypothetical protein
LCTLYTKSMCHSGVPPTRMGAIDPGATTRAVALKESRMAIESGNTANENNDLQRTALRAAAEAER